MTSLRTVFFYTPLKRYTETRTDLLKCYLVFWLEKTLSFHLEEFLLLRFST